MFDLTGKTAVVTGGSMGIGKAICIALAKQGADIVIVAHISMDKAEGTVSDIKKLGRKAIAIKCDVTKKEETDRLVKGVLDIFGKLDILVNNVGWDRFELFVKTTPDFWDKVIAINFKSVLNTTHSVIDHMTSRNYGRIINIGSYAGRVGILGESVYSGAKGAVIAFGKVMARELASNKITVNCVCPGPTPGTPLVTTMMKESADAAKFAEDILKMEPLGRMGTPEDIGPAVAFLASDEAEFITGQTLSVSGGLDML